ncbi:MAG: helix-turn-helix domain-containing protein [Candidatus Omnitrophica bacterium]|nr:helix-turn-helix domain-containing protein [Candidatus Omnitrophota bacterium]
MQEVILRAISGEIHWIQAAEILGISDRQMRRWKRRYCTKFIIKYNRNILVKNNPTAIKNLKKALSGIGF